MKRDTSELERFLHSTVYAVFGFGTKRSDFARRLMDLSRENPAEFALLHDIADRVSFVDRLRFEIGWQADYDETGTYTPGFASNLDALETYLLCTCIDALANAQSPVSFLDWVQENYDKMRESLRGEAILSPEAFLEVTERLHRAYEEAGAGLTRNFIGFFVDLPDFLRRAIADGFVLVKGAPWDREYGNRLERWWKLSEEKKLRRIAGDYLYGIRRSEYTHLSRWQEAASPSHWRRVAATRGEPRLNYGGGRWHWITLERRIRETEGDFFGIRGDREVQFTLFKREPPDEGFVLRAVIAISVLRRMLGYVSDERHLHELLKYYAAREAIYAFLDEMRGNQDYTCLLVSPEAITSVNDLQYLPVGGFATHAGRRLVQDYPRYIEVLRRDIGSYLHWLDEVNRRVAQFNADSPPKTGDWRGRQSALVKFSLELHGSYEIGQLRWYHRWVYSNLKRLLEAGHLQERFGSILDGWAEVWEELRQNLQAQPVCQVHPEYPCVSTLAQGVVNDITEIGDEGITVRSHRTLQERLIRATRLRAWWDHLLLRGSASLTSRSPNIPRIGHARVVGALLAAGLPDRIRVVDHNTIELKSLSAGPAKRGGLEEDSGG